MIPAKYKYFCSWITPTCIYIEALLKLSLILVDEIVKFEMHLMQPPTEIEQSNLQTMCNFVNVDVTMAQNISVLQLRSR